MQGAGLAPGGKFWVGAMPQPPSEETRRNRERPVLGGGLHVL